MLYRCITNIERIFDKKKRQTASFSNIFGKISDFMCQTPEKVYTFEEYDEVVQERKQVDFFEPYVFDVR